MDIASNVASQNTVKNVRTCDTTKHPVSVLDASKIELLEKKKEIQPHLDGDPDPMFAQM